MNSVPHPNPNLTDKVLRIFGYQPRLPEPVWRGWLRLAVLLLVIVTGFGIIMIAEPINDGGGFVVLPFPIFLSNH